jgi:tellurite resistance protein TerA
MAVNLGKVTLEKKGEQRTVSLDKGRATQTIHVNLNWEAPARPAKGLLGGLFGGGGRSAPDLDLGCMYRLRDGSAGVIQPLGGNFGDRGGSPWIFLDKDDRSGAAADGENLYFYRPQEVDLAIVFAMIYEGASDFVEVGGRMTLHDAAGGETLIRLNAPERGRTFCVVASLRSVADGVVITKEERYFSGHEQADRAYRFGFRWRAGSK